MRRAGGGLLQRQMKKTQQEKAQRNVAHRQQFIEEMVNSFTESLKQFAIQHKDEIIRHPEFRLKFHALCKSVGIDPLTSSKGIWASLLGVGNFYYELSVQIVDICISTRSQNGGLIELSELKSRLNKLRIRGDDISNDDILRALGKLNILRSGYSIQHIGSQTLIQSVPTELNQDQKYLIEVAQKHGGHLTVPAVTSDLHWSPDRITRTIQDMLKDGTMMTDNQDPSGETVYWVVGLLQVSSDGTLTISTDTS